MSKAPNVKNTDLYQYLVTGYYFAGEERKRFERILFAEDNVAAMQTVIGEVAWKESLEGNSFKLDVIHYDCWS